MPPPAGRPLGAELRVGLDDAAELRAGWWPVVCDADGEPVRWTMDCGRAVLRVPPGATHAGVELWVPRRRRAPRIVARLTLCDPYAGTDSGSVPFADACFRLVPGRRQVIECPLPVALLPGSEVALELRIEPARRRLRARLVGDQTPHGAAVRRMWVRGPRASAADVVIVVLNWRRPDETITCLESLAAADLSGARTLVVDNGSNDGSVARIRARFPDQWIVELPENRGYAGGNNAGIRAALDAGAGAVLLLNNDAQVAPDFLMPLLWALNSHRAVAGVSSAILRADHPQVLDVAWLDLYWGHGIIRRRGVNAMPGEGYHYRREVDAAVGCCLLLSREALQVIGPLDERYFAYHEEVDWCLRARRAGFVLLYEPMARVFHGGSKSTELFDQPLRSPRRRAEQLANPMPLSWNPVRTYLGGRNTVRFVRQNGGLSEWAYFAASSAYNVPLEFLAMLMREEEGLKIGAFGFRRALSLYLSGESEDAPAGGGRLRRAWRLLALPFWLGRESLRAHRAGRDAQVLELVRGLWDGVLDRELPLQRLKLR
jgi:GT2 family glycosyltransferase